MFLPAELGVNEFTLLNMSYSGGADRDMQTGCRSRKKRDVMSWVRPPVF